MEKLYIWLQTLGNETKNLRWGNSFTLFPCMIQFLFFCLESFWNYFFSLKLPLNRIKEEMKIKHGPVLTGHCIVMDVSNSYHDFLCCMKCTKAVWREVLENIWSSATMDLNSFLHFIYSSSLQDGLTHHFTCSHTLTAFTYSKIFLCRLDGL